MAIHRLLQNCAFTPEDIGRLAAVYTDCLRHLQIEHGSDARCEPIAKAIIEVAQTGQRDPVALRELALRRAGLAD